MIRHDRTGEPIEEDDEVVEQTELTAPETTGPVPHECDGGFVDRDADPPLKPCLICKPHLAPDEIHRKAFGPDREDDPRRTDPLNTKRNLETS